MAKGGIAASDIGSRGFGVRRAEVAGQMLPGQISVWFLPGDSTFPGLPYVIFPGNVGEPGDARRRHRAARRVRRLGAAMKRLGFIGLGAMGAPMARNLVAAGFELAVFDVDKQRARAFAEDSGVRAADSAADASADADALVVMVADGAQATEAPCSAMAGPPPRCPSEGRSSC